LTHNGSNTVKIGSPVWPREVSKIRGHKNGKKTRESDISPMCQDAPTGAIVLNYGVRSDIADIINHAKLYINLFSDFGVLTPPILPFSIGLAGRPYNSVNTTMLHCD